jgi:glycosyltransferase A (GT-A) superfamily protein (DUF2064 family)
VTATLAVIAKAPRPGMVKTRLCPPCTPDEAAAVAEAALRDTLAAVRATPAGRRVLVLDGAPGAWLGPGFDIVAQRGDGLDERLEQAFATLGGPTLMIGMDTPQVTPALLTSALRATRLGPAALGPARDGGYWAIGLRDACPGAVRGVPMSHPDTYAAQHRRLRTLGLEPLVLSELTDVDDIASARAVAAAMPASSAFAGAVARLGVAEAVA